MGYQQESVGVPRINAWRFMYQEPTPVATVWLGTAAIKICFTEAGAVCAQAALTAVSEGYDAIKVDTVAMDRHGNPEPAKPTGSPIKLCVWVGDRMAAIRDAVGLMRISFVSVRLTDTTSAIQFWPHDRRTGHLLLRRAGHAVEPRADEAGCR